jgi:hypothetical protein
LHEGGEGTEYGVAEYGVEEIAGIGGGVERVVGIEEDGRLGLGRGWRNEKDGKVAVRRD